MDAQYTNKQHLDKLIITILFAEIGYLSHTVQIISFPIILAVIIGFIGILFSIESYRCVNKSLLYEEQIKEFEIYSILNLDNYSNDMLRIEKLIQNNKIKIDIYEKIMYYCVISTSFIAFEFLYFSKAFEIKKIFYDACYINKFVLFTALIILIFVILKDIYEKYGEIIIKWIVIKVKKLLKKVI